MTLQIPILKSRKKNNIPNFDWKFVPTLVEITTSCKLDIGLWSSKMDGSTYQKNLVVLVLSSLVKMQQVQILTCKLLHNVKLFFLIFISKIARGLIEGHFF